MMRNVKRSDLIYDYPEKLVATEPASTPRCLLWSGQPTELTKAELLDQFASGDVLVVNDTKVVKRRVFSEEGLEILFIRALSANEWEVLFPARKLKIGSEILLPGNLTLKLSEKGLPQRVKASQPIHEAYFEKYGEMALPPYIQKARGERHMKESDGGWYQTDWAEKSGSCAAPTASLHFSNADLERLRKKGVKVLPVTLHVGLGTFLPIKVDDLNEHEMHYETGEISKETLTELKKAKDQGQRVWSLGTTATRIIESWPKGLLTERADGSLSGETNLFIQPGFDYEVVDVLMTNFHQPESTLLCLVSAFAGHQNVKETYQWAIKREFRLFSYGDLSVWMKP